MYKVDTIIDCNDNVKMQTLLVVTTCEVHMARFLFPSINYFFMGEVHVQKWIMENTCFLKLFLIGSSVRFVFWMETM